MGEALKKQSVALEVELAGITARHRYVERSTRIERQLNALSGLEDYSQRLTTALSQHQACLQRHPTVYAAMVTKSLSVASLGMSNTVGIGATRLGLEAVT